VKLHPSVAWRVTRDQARREVYAHAAIGGHPEAEISADSERDLVTWPPSGLPTELLASEVRLGDR